MATRLAFAVAHGVRTPALRSTLSFQIPMLFLGPRTVSFRRAALLARSSTTSTANVGEVSTRSARSKQHPPPTTSSPPPPAQTIAQQPSVVAAATARSSSATGNTAKQSPGFESGSSSNSNGGKSRTADPTTAAAASATSKQALQDSDSTQTVSDEHATNSSGGGGGGGGGSSNGGQGGHRGPLTWGAVGLLGVVGALAMGYYRMKWDEKQKRVSSEVTSTGKPALGGPFTLVDMHGRPVTDKNFHGKFVLLYFGFCHCPDICPSELVKVGAIAKKLEGKLGEGVVKPVFVSVDPDRDSLAQLRHYAQDFHPSVEYLTGTKDQVAKAAKAYRVYFSKTEEHDEDEDYMLDHSIVIYLLAPNGEFLDFYTQRSTITDCVERTVKQVKEFKAQ